MTEYQLQYLRFLRMKEEFPELNHRGHEPVPTWQNVSNGAIENHDGTAFLNWEQRKVVEFEFYRPVEREEPPHTDGQWATFYERALVIAQRSDHDRLEVVKKLYAESDRLRHRFEQMRIEALRTKGYLLGLWRDRLWKPRTETCGCSVGIGDPRMGGHSPACVPVPAPVREAADLSLGVRDSGDRQAGGLAPQVR